MENRKNALTLTVIANMTSNYGEGLGNISSVQKVFKNGSIYATRSRESLKNAVMVQSGMYDDLVVVDNGAAQKDVSAEKNAATCRALEGGYMNTNVKIGKSDMTFIRNSSFYFTDAIACEPFVNEPRFHNNLHLATTLAKEKGLNVQNDAGKVGLMPYNYEYDKNLKIYSITFDLEMVGKDENFQTNGKPAETDSKEKVERINNILSAIESLNLIVKGNLDNAEPLFIVGGISNRKTHVFENVVKVKNGKLSITQDLIDKIALGFKTALLEGDNFINEREISEKLKPVSVTKFFVELKKEVEDYYNGASQ